MGNQSAITGSVRTPADGAAGSPAEAWAWLQQQLDSRPVPAFLAIIGMGEGYLLDALEEHAPETRVLAIEPSADDARAFLSRRDWSVWRSSGRLVHLVDPDYTGAGDAWRMVPVDAGERAIRVLAHPRLRLGEEVARATQVLKQVLFDAHANADARRRLAPRYLTNSLRNIPAIVAGNDLASLKGTYRGVPAVIAAAGPSLDASIDELRAMEDKAVVFACDTALRPLLMGGITPQFVVGIDPSALNARHFLSLPECANTRLICDLALDRRATAVFEERTLWFRVADHHPWPWLDEFGLHVEHVDVWGSVLTAAFQVACLAGCDPIVLVGADLSFTGGRSYARGTTYELDWGAATGSGADLEKVWRGQMGDQVSEVEDVRGAKTQVTPAMLSFRDWLVTRAQRSGRQVINATGAGLLFGKGIEQATLSASLALKPAIPPVPVIGRRATAIRPSALAGDIRAVTRQLRDGSMAPPLAQWREFSGEGFDAVAVAAALDEAAHTLETKRGKPIETPVTSWSRLAASTAAPSFLTQVPEALTRFRLALGGVDAALDAGADGVGTHARRSAVLVEALDLLREICDAVLRMDDVHTAANPTLIGRLPVSVLYPWPDATRWAMVAFEALLGHAWGDVVQPPGPTWFGRTDGLVTRDTAGGAASQTQPSSHGSASRLACLQLVLEWMRCGASVHGESTVALYDALDRVVALEEQLRGARAHDTEQTSLIVEASAGSRSARLVLPLPVGQEALAKVVTGIMREPADASHQLVTVGQGDACVVIRLTPTRLHRSGKAGVPTRTFGASVAPKALTHPGAPQGVVAYSSGDEVVVVLPHGLVSFAFDADGRARAHNEWPRPIYGELRLGGDGFAAWGLGIGGGPAVGPGYVMFRKQRGGKVHIEELPIRPSVGVWWQGRLYWSCYPRVVDTWVGVASWAPGEAVRYECPDLTLFDMQPDGGSLLMQPCVFDARGRFFRRRVSQGWRWQPGGVPDPVALGPLGAASWRSTNGRWTATSYPESDLIQLDAVDGRSRHMTCHYPSRAAWAGESLVVSTVSRELLLFEHMSGVLESQR